MLNKFNIFLISRFERDFKKIQNKDNKIINTFGSILEILKIDPFNKTKKHNIKKLAGLKEGEGQWRIRLGSYRIRYDIIKSDILLYSISAGQE